MQVPSIIALLQSICMFLTYVQHVGCATRMLVISPPSPQLKCPDCGILSMDSNWSDTPLPCPFVEQVNVRCAIVIKPTRGFFQSYKIGDDLHIGISDSHSVVHSYWTNGISSENASWDMSIVVHQFTDEDASWFDDSLSQFLTQYSSNFVPHLYSDIEWNCFDLVMEFLRYVNFRNYTKVHFVAEFVQESLKTAIKYCKLVSKVQEKGCIMIA